MRKPSFWNEIEVSAEDIKQAQTIPSNFGLSSRHEKYAEIMEKKTWSLGSVIEHRDSNNLDKSNAAALQKFLNEYKDIENDWMITECNHWAVGWVKHLSFRIFNKDGKTPSKAFKLIKHFYNELESYGCADESDYSQREHEDTLQNLEDCAKQCGELKDIQELPDNWVELVYGWFSENYEYQYAIESSESWAKSEDMKECLGELGFLEAIEE